MDAPVLMDRFRLTGRDVEETTLPLSFRCEDSSGSPSGEFSSGLELIDSGSSVCEEFEARSDFLGGLVDGGRMGSSNDDAGGFDVLYLKNGLS